MSDSERGDGSGLTRRDGAGPTADDTIEAGASSDEGRSTGRRSAKTSPSGTFITVATALALVVATGLTLLGVGAADNAVANFDASSWLWSSSRGELDRVNGVTARVDTRTKIKDTQNHDVQVSQTDRFLILRDLDTGQVSALDLTTLQINAVMPTTPGLGVSVALHGETAFVIDTVQGHVSQLDPRTLSPVGDAITLPGGIVAGGFDGKATLWVALPTEGTVVAIRPGTAGAGPAVVRTVTVTAPGHDLVVSVLDEGVAVLDNTNQALLTVRGNDVAAATVPIDKPAALPSRTSGSAVPVTVVDDRRVVVVDGEQQRQFSVPGAGPLAPAVAFAGRVYCADARNGVVYEFDASGRLIRQIRIPAAGGPLELEVRENHLFINAPDGSTARVVDEKHTVKEVDKYADGVLGGDPPPPPPPDKEPEPRITVPGRPQGVTASAGDGSVRISWRRARDNGAPITKYVVEGAGQTVTVGAKHRSVQIKGLTNGKTYRFTVRAVNAKGPGPKATSPAVTPSADVPDPPKSVTAQAKPDGTIVVTWPAANGLGRKIRSYQVTAITDGAQAPVGEVRGTKMTVAAGTIPYGTQVAFTVVAVNDRNAGSDPSPASNTVVPYNKPGAPRNLTAATASDRRGAIQVSWQAAEDNGRPIERYVVEAGGQTQDVTGTSVTLAGFDDDTAVQVKVHAVNEAGGGPAASATARTIGMPTVTVTSSRGDYNTVSVTFTPNNKGGAATCRVQIGGASAVQSGCTTRPLTLTVRGLWPNNTYDFTVTVTTAAGTATARGRQATSQLRATVICGDTSYCGNGIYLYSTPNNANPSNAVGRLYKGDQFTPLCKVPNADTVDARPWGGRRSDYWLRRTYQGRNAYFPFAWVNIDGGNDISRLPTC